MLLFNRCTSPEEKQKEQALEIYTNAAARVVTRNTILETVPNYDKFMGINSNKEIKAWQKTIDSIDKIYKFNLNLNKYK